MKLTCPDCRHPSEQTSEWIAKTLFYRCAACKVMIQQHPDTIAIARAAAELEDILERTFGEFLKK